MEEKKIENFEEFNVHGEKIYLKSITNHSCIYYFLQKVLLAHYLAHLRCWQDPAKFHQHLISFSAMFKISCFVLLFL